MPDKNQEILDTLTTLLRNTLEREDTYVLCIETDKGSRICAAGGFEPTEAGDLEQARLLERFARRARESAKR